MLDIVQELSITLLNLRLLLFRYIYTDILKIGSIDKACQLCYVAKKYMLPFVVEKCTEFIWLNLNAENVCRSFEFALLFEEPDLAAQCLQVFTCNVITSPQQVKFPVASLLGHLYTNK